MSTGAAIALAALPLAARSNRAVYVESYSRFAGPSLTGNVLSKFLPRVELFSQHPFADTNWTWCGSILDGVTAPKNLIPSRNGPLTIFVTLGTIRPYRFDALVDRVLEVAPVDSDFIWQLGATVRRDLPGEVHSILDPAAFRDRARRAHVVISHGGAGTAIDLVELGHRPILVPRRASHGEHVDDHQQQIVADFSRRSLAMSRGVGEIQVQDLLLKGRP